jgi:outer membrane protein TolC
MNKRVDILQARENIIAKRVENQVAGSYYGPGSYTYEESRYSLLQAESTLRDKLKSAEVSIKTSYLKIRSLEEQYHLAETTLKQAKEVLLATQKRYEVGLAATTEVTAASAALSQTESKLADVLLQYNLAKVQFNFELGNY